MNRKWLFPAVLLCCLWADALPAATGSRAPFRPAVEGGGLLFLSGQLGETPPGQDPDGPGFEAAVHDAMDSLGRVLAANGRDFGDVVKCTVMLKDMSKWDRFNDVYVRYFAVGKLPARSAFGGVMLAMNAPLEVECVATVRDRR